MSREYERARRRFNHDQARRLPSDIYRRIGERQVRIFHDGASERYQPHWCAQVDGQVIGIELTPDIGLLAAQDALANRRIVP